jgi:cyclophilin family peptidyl-prolyl cis-trans isomerase
VLLLTAATFAWSKETCAQVDQVNLNSLVDEIFKVSPNPDAMTMVMWMPEEYWRVSNEGSGMAKEQLEEMLAVLRPYTLIAAVDGTVGPFGGVRYVSEPTLRESIWLVDGDGNTYRPLPEKQVDPDTRNLLAMMTPIWSQLMGATGEHFVAFAFPVKDGQGHRIAEATMEGQFSVRVGQEEFSWRLPLGSLIPQKVCPVDGELMSGAWRYCPWHGVELLGVVDTGGVETPDSAVSVEEPVGIEFDMTPTVVLETTLGRIVIELDRERAPITVANFLTHVNAGFYDGLIFHRVMPNFVIQTGLLTTDYVPRRSSAAFLQNEGNNGLKNLRGTLGMARGEDPHTAKSQFFINVNDNPQLDTDEEEWGWAVFGKVIEGMDVVDRIKGVPTEDLGTREYVPVEPIVIQRCHVTTGPDTTSAAATL